MTNQIPTGIQPHIPNVARMYDYYLGGKDNFPADREAAEQVLKVVPEIRYSARSNRAFLGRAVAYLAEAGIRQFLDIGAGLPTQNNVHQVAPGARVVYVDNDPTVLVHGRAILGKNENVTIVEGDVRRPAEILANPDVRAAIDFDQPVAVLLLAIMHFVPDEDDPDGVIATLRAAMAPGSHLALSHVAIDARPEAADGVTQVYDRASSPFVARTGKEIIRMFDGFDVVEPGIVNLPEWRPEPGAAVPYRGIGNYFLGGVGVVTDGG
ncbi:O-methyltransferase involved in polyketide biosynthesis [Streptosporangium becharense]|uniref:O-methyltransferase involved in polyketide biosynthesis n=1 Tax=Streptosporangium becharense TaxID=1816182 RepID=A0A7W9MG93_9ACTN|nr:SAM-dependent methyltransferase [Streptosporangium becharense]MBB2909912.1 O-methyltransferase involved in polyketide biosynthesis [Streptosporangium becharense]MBB5819133.1 O-methyltransferase involved in polyketide biosynthesis [Streptosporangium becharense]